MDYFLSICFERLLILMSLHDYVFSIFTKLSLISFSNCWTSSITDFGSLAVALKI